MPSPIEDLYIGILARNLDDLEKIRIASNNRLRTLTTKDIDEDGIQRGLDLPSDSPVAMMMSSIAQGLADLEAPAISAMQKHMRKSLWGPWLKSALGVGEKQLARLLAEIGDPYWNNADDRSRTVSALWAYCGMHVVPHEAGGADVVAPARRRGAQHNWSEQARKRIYLIAESCLKQLKKSCVANKDLGYAVHVDNCECSKYRRIYDATRQRYASAVHQVECKRCGPSGKPAEPGSSLSDGHKHGRAIRAMGKAVLVDLWLEARQQHWRIQGYDLDAASHDAALNLSANVAFHEDDLVLLDQIRAEQKAFREECHRTGRRLPV